MLRISKEQARATESAMAQYIKGATCHGLGIETARFSSPVIHKYHVELEPRFQPFDPSAVFARTDELQPLTGIRKRKSKRRDMVILKIHFPLADKPCWPELEQGIRGLSAASDELSFDVVASRGRIGIYLHGVESSLQSLISRWQLILPELKLETALVDPLAEISEVPFELLEFADVYAPPPYHFMLTHGRDFVNAPMNSLFMSMSEIQSDEILFCHVMFRSVRNNWLGNMQAIIQADSMLGKRSPLPSCPAGQTKLSAGKPLFVVKLCLGCVSRRIELFEALLAHLGLYQWSGLNLKYRTKQDFLQVLTEAQIRKMFAKRESYTTGMLLNSEELTAFVHVPDSGITASKKAKYDRIVGFPVHEDLKDSGLPLGINRYAGDECNVCVPLSSRNPSIYIIGSTTAGKSTSIEEQILWYASRGYAVIIIDFHGDTADSILGKVPGQIIEKTRIFDLSDPEYVACLNLFEAEDQADIGRLSADYVESMRGMFPGSWGARLNHLLVHGVAGLFILERNLAALLPIYSQTRQGEQYRQEIVRRCKNPEMRRFWTQEFRSYAAEAFTPITNKISTLLMDERARRMFSVRKNTFPLKKMMEGGLTIIKLSIGLLGVDIAAWIGDMLLAQFQKLALRRAAIAPCERIPCFLFMDEFHRLKNLSVCHSIINECRKYKLYLTASHQETGQLSPEDFKAFTSMGNIMVFRLNRDDSKKMATIFNGMVQPEDIMGLSVGEVIARIENRVVNFTTFPPKDGSQAVAQTIYDDSHKLYYKPLAEVLADEQIGNKQKQRVFETF